MRLHDNFVLHTAMPPASGLVPGLRELYGLSGRSTGTVFRDLNRRLYGVPGGADMFYHAAFERITMAAADVTVSRANPKVGAVHRLYVAPPYRRRGTARELMLQAMMDFSVLGGEILLLTIPRADLRAYKWVRNVRFSTYPDVVFTEAPDPDDPAGLEPPAPAPAAAEPPPEPKPETSAAGEVSPSDGPTDSDGDSDTGYGYSEWGGHEEGDHYGADHYGDHYSDDHYGHYSPDNPYGVKPPLPDPTRTDGTALFFAGFGRPGLREFGLSYFNPGQATTARAARYSDWAGLMLLLNWPARRRLLHLHRPHDRHNPADLGIAELLERCHIGRAAAAVLETPDGALVGFASLARAPAPDDPRPAPPGKRRDFPPAPGPAVLEVCVHPDFADRVPALLEELFKLRAPRDAVAFAEPATGLSAFYEKAGFHAMGEVPAEVSAVAPDAVAWRHPG